MSQAPFPCSTSCGDLRAEMVKEMSELVEYSIDFVVSQEGGFTIDGAVMFPHIRPVRTLGSRRHQVFPAVVHPFGRLSERGCQSA